MSATNAQESESAALGSFAVRHTLLGACADMAAAGITPLEWGAGDASPRARGKAFPRKEVPPGETFRLVEKLDLMTEF